MAPSRIMSLTEISTEQGALRTLRAMWLIHRPTLSVEGIDIPRNIQNIVYSYLTHRDNQPKLHSCFHQNYIREVSLSRLLHNSFDLWKDRSDLFRPGSVWDVWSAETQSHSHTDWNTHPHPHTSTIYFWWGQINLKIFIVRTIMIIEM